jgi:predicted house-cleaning NTP pyrophosphatase (Maf/HAM1 superfamily)
VTFYTGLALYNSATVIYKPSANLSMFIFAISDQEIEDYVRKENPLHCAGSFKSEGLGLRFLNAWKAAIRIRWSVCR